MAEREKEVSGFGDRVNCPCKEIDIGRAEEGCQPKVTLRGRTRARQIRSCCEKHTAQRLGLLGVESMLRKQ